MKTMAQFCWRNSAFNLPHLAHGHEQHAPKATAGEPATQKAFPTIEVGMSAMAYAPARIEVKRGERSLCDPQHRR